MNLSGKWVLLGNAKACPGDTTFVTENGLEGLVGHCTSDHQKKYVRVKFYNPDRTFDLGREMFISIQAIFVRVVFTVLCVFLIGNLIFCKAGITASGLILIWVANIGIGVGVILGLVVITSKDVTALIQWAKVRKYRK